MSDFSGPLAGARRRPRKRYVLRPAVLVLIPVLAILFQVYSPRLLSYLAFLDLPLLVTVYFALLLRQPVWGLLIGCGIGLAQDAFSHQPVGIFGIVKTLVGYFAASLSQRVDVENPAIRFFIGFFFYFFHQVTHWVIISTLLAHPLGFSLAETFVYGLLNGVVAMPLFSLLDRQ